MNNSEDGSTTTKACVTNTNSNFGAIMNSAPPGQEELIMINDNKWPAPAAQSCNQTKVIKKKKSIPQMQKYSGRGEQFKVLF